MIERASTTQTPWSGYWWPQLKNDGWNLYSKDGPLAKYDAYVEATRGYNPGTRAFERANFRQTDSAYEWWGYCHAWVAASMLTDEPQGGATRAGIRFSQDDLEALITASYSNPQFEWLAGTRNDGSGRASEAFKDLNPAWLDYLMRTKVGGERTSFAMDILPGAQVWNYPVAGYTREATANDDGSQTVRMTVRFADAEEAVAGADTFTKTYTYRLFPTQGGYWGEWTGDSVPDHPDFAWQPTGRAQPSNARLDPEIVSEILGYSI